MWPDLKFLIPILNPRPNSLIPIPAKNWLIPESIPIPFRNQLQFQNQPESIPIPELESGITDRNRDKLIYKKYIQKHIDLKRVWRQTSGTSGCATFLFKTR